MRLGTELSTLLLTNVNYVAVDVIPVSEVDNIVVALVLLLISTTALRTQARHSLFGSTWGCLNFQRVRRIKEPKFRDGEKLLAHYSSCGIEA